MIQNLLKNLLKAFLLGLFFFGAVTFASITDKTTLKGYFETGDIPTSAGGATLNGFVLENQTGNFGIGTTTPLANFQVTNSSANATTSASFGKANQNKGTCLTFYDTAGTAVYWFIAAGETDFTKVSVKPSGCKD